MENIHVNKRYKELVQGAGFGDQTLPEDYIQQQLAGIQSKGIGPGKQGTAEDADDYDSDDEFDTGEGNNEGGFFASDDSEGEDEM